MKFQGLKNVAGKDAVMTKNNLIKEEPIIFELSSDGRKGFVPAPCDIPTRNIETIIPHGLIRKELNLPEISEVDVIRHFTRLSRMNYGVDTNIYPLGSCTMKYNPKINEEMALLEEFIQIHPYQDIKDIQGSLKILYELDNYLCEITGMDRFTLQPAAGAHGELTALLIAGAYFRKKGEVRTKILVPDSAHGTNPASASMAGFSVEEVPSDKDGNCDFEVLKEKIDKNTAVLMLTNPNTLGLFEKRICDIADLAHENGTLLYYDGANLNATMGIVRPGDMGFDMVHLNLHKTFSTPHGGGGPGSGPVGVKKELISFLPHPLVMLDEEKGMYCWENKNIDSIGKIHGFYGNFIVLLKAYCYIRALGANGLKEVSNYAVLNANYIKKALGDKYFLFSDRVCMHECVFSAKWQKENNGIKALDIAKRLLDYGYHAPTIYFPLIVEEALMIEPTETESLQSLKSFADAMKSIAKEADETPELLKSAPHFATVGRLDETTAARKPDLCYKG